MVGESKVTLCSQKEFEVRDWNFCSGKCADKSIKPFQHTYPDSMPSPRG